LSLPEPIKAHWLVYREARIGAETIRNKPKTTPTG
jgi:hypothetical protein